MKDVTVQLELTVPKGVSDREIQSFVEDAIKHYLSNRRYAQELIEADANGVAWANRPKTDWVLDNTILGTDENMTEVVAITEGYVGALPGWRDLSVPKPHGGAVLDAINNLPDLTD